MTTVAKKRTLKFTRPRAQNVAWVVDIHDGSWRWLRACRTLRDAHFWVKQQDPEARTRVRRFKFE